jgi:drug/metabolite transporter (DMT)-like permease
MERDPSTSGLAALQTAVLLFGLAGLFGKVIQAPPLIIVAGRTFFAAWALGVLLLCTKNNRSLLNIKKGSLAVLAFQGGILALHWWTFFYAIQISNVAVGLLGFAAFPMFVTLLEPICFKETYRQLDLVTAAVVTLGLLAVAWPVELSAQRTWGVLWGALSGFLFAILALFNRKYVCSLSPIAIAGVQNSVAFLVLLPFAAYAGWQPTWSQAGLLALLGVICTATAHALFIYSLKSVRAQLAGVIASLEPVYGIVFAFVLLGEKPAWTTLAGGALILAATMVAMLFRAQQGAPPDSVNEIAGRRDSDEPLPRREPCRQVDGFYHRSQSDPHRR